MRWEVILFHMESVWPAYRLSPFIIQLMVVSVDSVLWNRSQGKEKSKKQKRKKRHVNDNLSRLNQMSMLR